jgi:hypothetical protein
MGGILAQLRILRYNVKMKRGAAKIGALIVDEDS